MSGGSEAEQRDEMCGWRVEEGVWRKEIKAGAVCKRVVWVSAAGKWNVDGKLRVMRMVASREG